MNIVLFLLYILILVIMSAASYLNLKMKSKEFVFNQLHFLFNISFK